MGIDRYFEVSLFAMVVTGFVALAGTGKKGSAKGVVVTGADLKRHRMLFHAYSIVYPAIWAVSRLDQLLPWTSGYMLIVAATRRG